MALDIKKFRVSAGKKKKKLSLFLDKFDNLVPPSMQKMVAKADKEVWQEIDCTECANCCKTMTPIFTPADTKRIAGYMNLSIAEFSKKYLKIEKESGSTVIKRQPCPLLKDNKCSVYEVRPSDCAEFPHHNKKPFDLYNDTFKANLVHCPATLLLVEKLEKTVTDNFEF